MKEIHFDFEITGNFSESEIKKEIKNRNTKIEQDVYMRGHRYTVLVRKSDDMILGIIKL